jgi:hypothetical protein
VGGMERWAPRTGVAVFERGQLDLVPVPHLVDEVAVNVLRHVEAAGAVARHRAGVRPLLVHHGHVEPRELGAAFDERDDLDAQHRADAERLVVRYLRSRTVRCAPQQIRGDAS